jgi:hypothetical protein
MDDTKDLIIEYALILNPALEESEDLLDFVVSEVMDRTLIYTNRAQLVAQFEEDLTDETLDEEDYVYPIPVQLNRPLASVAVGVFKTVSELPTATTGAITSISDNGQSISYGSGIASYLSSTSDSEIFSSVRELLNKFRIPTIVENTSFIYNPSSKRILR